MNKVQAGQASFHTRDAFLKNVMQIDHKIPI